MALLHAATMLPPRAALLPLGLFLGWVPPTAIHAIATAAERLDDSKAFASYVQDARVHSAPVQQATQSSAHRLVLDRSPDGLFYAQAWINDRQVRFVVDTGSSVVVLTQHDAARIGVGTSTTSGRYVMQTAGGDVPTRTALIRRVRIGTQSVKDVDAMVVSEGLPTSLLGQNLLSQIGPITIEGNHLRLN